MKRYRIEVKKLPQRTSLKSNFNESLMSSAQKSERLIKNRKRNSTKLEEYTEWE